MIFTQYNTLFMFQTKGHPSLLPSSSELLSAPVRWATQRLYNALLRTRLPTGVAAAEAASVTGAGCRFGGGAPPTETAPPSVRVVCVSDTHNTMPTVPEADLLLHCGDLSVGGTATELQRQVDWLAGLAHVEHKVVIAGNHDSWFDVNARAHVAESEEGSAGGVVLANVTYLQDQAVTLEFKNGRRLKIFGSPWVPVCGGSAFAFQYIRHLHPWEGKIPNDVDIVMTHTPPRYHLDAGLGCAGLLAEIWRVQPRLHAFGHIHRARGVEPAFFDACQRAYEEAMSLPKRGLWLGGLLNATSWAAALRVLWHGVVGSLRYWIGLRRNPSLFVNAAVAGSMRELEVFII
ncbi:hypothetical protein HK405_013502 [Cladochytrium tenue]|nr:hypothetical protein HK405_013502 [Cladochytrium tenue]